MNLAYPNVLDVQAVLYAAGLISNPPSEQQHYLPILQHIEGAIAQFETDCGWRPFLGTAVAHARRFDPPGLDQQSAGRAYVRGGQRILDLRAGLLTLTSLYTGVSTSSAGSALTVNESFFLRPTEAAYSYLPYTEIEFGFRMQGAPNSISVTGTWGRMNSVPSDVWVAIAQKAAAGALPTFAVAKTGGLTKWSEADVEETYSADTFGNARDAWDKQYEAAVHRYKRDFI